MIRKLISRLTAGSSKAGFENYPDLPEPGSPAPGFSLPAIRPESLDQGEISLADLRGRPAVLVFYPKDGSSVCSSQLALYNEALHLVEEHDAHLVGISVDNLDSHQAFARQLKLSFPLLSDGDPAGETARAFGIFDEEDGVCERALFVLDADGRIHWRAISPRKVNPGMDGILGALESLAENGKTDGHPHLEE